MNHPQFDDLTDIYEAMIDWPKRLANEEPFYRGLFGRMHAHRVLDAACGTGRHAALFHTWGLRVEGADLSPKMIARARAAFGEADTLHWVVRGFDQPVRPAEPFDLVLCVGNSLALAPDQASVAEAIRQMLAGVHPDGAVVLQVMNLWALPDGPCVWQKCRRATLPRGEVLILKGVHRCANRGYVELAAAPLAGELKLQSEPVPFLGLEAAELERLAHQSGAARVRVFGGYQNQPYLREKSPDLLLVLEK